MMICKSCNNRLMNNVHPMTFLGCIFYLFLHFFITAKMITNGDKEPK